MFVDSQITLFFLKSQSCHIHNRWLRRGRSSKSFAFSSVFLPYNPVLSATNAELEETDPLCSARIDIDVVDSAFISVAICLLQAYSSAGTDGIQPLLLKTA